MLILFELAYFPSEYIMDRIQIRVFSVPSLKSKTECIVAQVLTYLDLIHDSKLKLRKPYGMYQLNFKCRKMAVRYKEQEN